MRADRLVAALLILQSRGRVTAAELAEELEVSERTARRDLEGLAMAGIPVYAQQGRGGGWALMGGARTDLSGLTAPEARALFLVAGPSSSATPEVKAALRKLVRALPETFRADAEAATAAVVVDPTSWGGWAPRQSPHLNTLQQAVVDGLQVRLGYEGRDKAASERVVHPLGLVAKGSVWYLVAGTEAGLRTFRVSRVTSVEALQAPVERPEGFDLEATWRSIAAEVDARRLPADATVLVDKRVLGPLRGVFGRGLVIVGDTDDGRVEVTIAGRSAEMIAAQIAGFGDQVEISGPPEARAFLAQVGRQLTALYA